MSNRIQIPYTFTGTEKQCIKDNFSTYHDWEKNVFDTIKKNIIDHLRPQQGNACCYCKKQLGHDIAEVDIEHIIPKSQYDKFTFKSENLALSCKPCNTKKSTKEVLKKEIKNYPRSSSNFKIIHAHYDNYFEHIDIVNECIFVARTTEGSETITFCELFRLSSVEEANIAYEKLNTDRVCSLIDDIKGRDTASKDRALDTILRAIG